MVVASNPRAGRAWRTLLAHQSAKGTAVTAFSSATQLWATASVGSMADDQIEPEWWFNYHNGDFQNARYAVQNLRRGVIEAHATPALLLSTLQNLYGTYSSPNFTLVGYVNKWLSIGFVEDKSLVNTTHRFSRYYDALIHQMTLDVDSTGYVDASCAFVAEEADNRATSALAGVTLPAAPMDTTDRGVFPGRAATLYRDPSGANVAIPFEKLAVSLDVNVDEFWDMCGQKSRAIRRGPLSVTLVATGRAGDEYWQAAVDSVAGTRQTYRLTLTDAVGGHAFTMTFYNATFNLPPYGLRDQAHTTMVARGVATQDASGNFVSISLT